VDNTPLHRHAPSRWNQTAFSSRSNPNRPPHGPGRKRGGVKEGDRRYPEACHPNRARAPLSEAQRELAAQYLPLARSLAIKLANSWPAAGDEFESAASLALVEAAQTFDSTRNVGFATYARYRIVGALRDAHRELCSRGWKPDRKHTHAPKTIRLADSSEDHGTMIGCEPDKPVGADLETTDTVERWIRQLPRQHATAFRHIYLDGKSQDEAAALVGCSRATLSRLHRQALTWLQQAHEFDDRG
jgi:RNA polymerase sigma factor (sigma-70 family)